MLSGLEAAEIGFLETVSNKRERIDSEYFKKEFIANAASIRGCDAISCLVDRSRLRSVKALSVTKPFSYLEISRINMHGGDYGLVSVGRENIPDRADKILRNGDVVVSMVRPNRNAAALIRNAKRLVATSGLAVLRARKIDPKYLFAYCKTRHFVVSLVRETTATMYPAVSRDDVFEVSFPFPSAAMQSGVCAIISKCFECLDSSKRQYQSAQQLLARELGIADFRPDESGIAIKSFGEFFAKTDRLDAEFYCAQASQMREVMLAKGARFAPMSEMFEIKTALFTPEEDLDYKYIELADIGDFGEVRSFSRYRGKNLPDRARRIVAAGDVILSLVEGSISSCALIDDAHDGFLCSTGFAVLSPRKTISAAALILCKSVYMREALKATASGTILTSVNPKRFGDIPAPILATGTQKQIAKMIRKAADLRRESNRLLAVAKRAVEITIEKGEAEALRFIEKSRAD